MDTLGFEVFDIIRIEGETTIIPMRIFGVVNDISIDFKTTLVCPDFKDDYDWLSEHIYTNVLTPHYQNLLTPIEEVVL